MSIKCEYKFTLIVSTYWTCFSSAIIIYNNKHQWGVIFFIYLVKQIKKDQVKLPVISAQAVTSFPWEWQPPFLQLWLCLPACWCQSIHFPSVSALFGCLLPQLHWMAMTLNKKRIWSLQYNHQHNFYFKKMEKCIFCLLLGRPSHAPQSNSLLGLHISFVIICNEISTDKWRISLVNTKINNP